MMDGQASGNSPQLVERLPTLRAAYSDRVALLMAELSAAAYEPFDIEGEASLRNRVGGLGFDVTKTFFATRKKSRFRRSRGTEAYFCENAQMAVLVFRGSTTGIDWLTNINIFKKKIPTGQYDGEDQFVKVHAGFYRAFGQHWDAMQVEVDRVILNTPNKPIFITGHSLGGALAQLATAAFSCDQIAACYTFGSPRAGGKSLDLFVKPPHYRVTNQSDTVPFLPAYLLGYRHAGDARSLVGKPPTLRRHSRGIFHQWIIVLLLFPALILNILTFKRVQASSLIGHHNIQTYVARLEELVARRSTLQNTEFLKG
ncbi:MAG: lipase family protein [Pseudomonadota bacterium]